MNRALGAAILGLAVTTLAVSDDRFGFESQFSLKTTLMPAPLPDNKKLELDVDQAVAEIEARQRAKELIRELFLAPTRRPDLTHDVVTGIQGRALDNARRRR